MDALNWSQLLANIATLLLMGLAVAGGFRRFINEKLVALDERVTTLEQDRAETKALSGEISHVKDAVNDLKDEMKETAEQHRKDLNGGLDRLYKTLLDYVNKP